jgi:Double zinc ribbon
MSVNTCPFCEQINPAEAKFCNACGGALHLAPCPKCGAVNDVAAAQCYQCHARLPGGSAAKAATPAAPAELPGSSSRQHPRALVGVASLAAAVAVLVAYYGYRPSSYVDLPESVAASSARGAPGGPAQAGTAASGQDPAAGDANPAMRAGGIGPADAAAPAQTGTSPPERASAPQEEPRSDREAEESRPANTATGQIARPVAAGKAPTRRPSRQEVCTSAVAALGLCTMTPEEKRLAEATAALKAVIAEPAAGEPGKAGKQGPPREERCTEAVAALGLCPPASRQRGE